MTGHRYLRFAACFLAFFPLGDSAASDGAPASAPRSGWRPAAHIREAIAAKLPKYVPHQLAAETGPEEEMEVRQGMIILPKMMVDDDRLPAPRSDMAWLTPRGRLDRALKQYPGTRIGNILGTNNGWALFRQVEAVEAGRKDVLKERVESVVLDDTAYDRQTLNLLKAALMPINREFAK